MRRSRRGGEVRDGICGVGERIQRENEEGGLECLQSSYREIAYGLAFGDCGERISDEL